jgi:hypothetical protein
MFYTIPAKKLFHSSSPRVTGANEGFEPSEKRTFDET